MSTLFSVTDNPLTGGGIFTAIQQLDPPWAEDNIALKLDIIYYGNMSGSKVTSPLVDRLLSGSKLSADATATLAGALMATNGERWSREWATLSAEYDPIQNYNMEEEMTDDETVTEYGHTRTRTDNLAHSETRTDNLSHSETRTDNLTHTVDEEEKTTPGITTTRQEATRGFNSNSDVNTDKVTESASGHTTVEHDNTEHHTGTVGTTGSDTGTVGTTGSNTGTQSTQGSDTGTQGIQGTNTGTQADAESGSDTQTRNYKLTRKGNIGVTTSQQMLESERELWKWNYFYDVVFPDVDQLLTSPFYAEVEESEVVGIIPTGTIHITANGEFDVYHYAVADVQLPNTYTVDDEGKVVHNGALTEQGTETLTENGIYNTMLIGQVNVQVPNSYTESDEGKVVHNGTLTEQGTETLTENGTYDTTLIGSVTVNFDGVKMGDTLPSSSEGAEGDYFLLASPIEDVTLNGDAISNPYSATGNKDPNNAFDGNTTTFWTTTDNNFTNMYIGRQFSSAKALAEVRILPRVWNNNTQVGNVTIEYSDDGVTWSQIGDMVHIPRDYGSDWYSIPIAGSQPHTYWRLYFTTDSTGKINGSATCTIFEITIFAKSESGNNIYVFGLYRKINGSWVDVMENN